MQGLIDDDAQIRQEKKEKSAQFGQRDEEAVCAAPSDSLGLSLVHGGLIR